MEALSLLLALVTFLAIAGIGLAVIGMMVPRQQLLQDRLAGYGRTAPQVANVSDLGQSILKDHQHSNIPILQNFLSNSSMVAGLTKDLVTAGLALRAGEYLLIRWVFGLVLAAAPIVLFELPWILAVPIGVIGFYIPKFYVKRLQKQRVNKFNDQLVDGLSMMANALRSGSSFLQSLDMVGRELPAPIGDEFAHVVAEVGVGMPIDDALRGLTQRVNSYDLYLCVTAMVIQRQTGGNLAEILENISNTIRERIKLLRQVEVMSAEERFSAMIVGLIPVFILVALMILNPNYHGPFLATDIGKIVFAVAGGLQLLGFWLMQKVAQIEV